MINQKYSKIIIALCGMMIVPYLIGVCMTYEFWEMAAYLSAMIGVAVVVLPTLISYNRVGKILKPIPIILTAILFIALVGFRYWNWKYCFYSCFVVLWPVICYCAINSITSKITSKNNKWLAILFYNIIVVAIIYFVQEHIYKFSVADVIAEVFLYIVSQIALLLAIKKQGIGKKEIAIYIVCNIVFPIIWFTTQERIGEIIASLNYSFTSLDAESGYNNWFAQRVNLLKSNINGDYSTIYRRHIYTIMRNCSLSHFCSNGYAWLSAIIFVATTILSGIMIKISVLCKNNWMKVLLISFVIKNIIGLLANIFLFYSTSIGMMIIDNHFDIIPIVWILFANKTQRNRMK